MSKFPIHSFESIQGRTEKGCFKYTDCGGNSFNISKEQIPQINDCMKESKKLTLTIL